MDRRSLLFVGLTAVSVALAAAPAAVVFGLGWLTRDTSSWGGAAGDRTPEAWALFALFYLLWMVALTVVVIIVNDRLGRHWRSWDRRPRSQKKDRRRLAAGLKYLAGQEKARAEAGRDAARGRAARRQPPASRRRNDT